MAKNTRVPSAVGSIPVVGDLVKQADAQAQWLQELVEQNARLVGQLPATIKTFNDSLERFNQTVGRLDRAVSRMERATSQLIGPLEQVTPQLDRQVAQLAAAVDRVLPWDSKSLPSLGTEPHRQRSRKRVSLAVMCKRGDWSASGQVLPDS